MESELFRSAPRTNTFDCYSIMQPESATPLVLTLLLTTIIIQACMRHFADAPAPFHVSAPQTALMFCDSTMQVALRMLVTRHLRSQPHCLCLLQPRKRRTNASMPAPPLPRKCSQITATFLVQESCSEAQLEPATVCDIATLLLPCCLVPALWRCHRTQRSAAPRQVGLSNRYVK